MNQVAVSFPRALGAIGVVLLIGSSACNRDRTNEDSTTRRPLLGQAQRDPAGAATLTGARVGAVPNDDAIARIVSARCQRETSCNNVGADKHFMSPAMCASELQPKVANDLKASACPRGVDVKSLDTCMEAIRLESCNNPIDTISRIAACRTSDLCLTKDENPSR